MQCGLLGRTLRYSYSPQIHAFLGDYSYHIYEKEPADLASFFYERSFDGINVTIPYKKAVIPFLDELSEQARQLSAVNTIVKAKDGRLIGHNTDLYGFSTMLRASGLEVAGKKALVLGSGGASNTACHVLAQAGANVVVISRSGANNYTNLHLHSDACLIVNATPVGTWPAVDEQPVSLEGFLKLEGVLDLIYNPARTALLLEAEQRGLIAMNGLLMLVAQAKESAEWFTGHEIDNSVIQTIHRCLKSQMENIVLIGMPGCGKTTIASILSARLNRPVVDADTEIERLAGCSIPDIFRHDGEAAFRKLETEVLRQYGARSGIILSTGGGCVTQPENYPLLHRNGTIFCIHRELALLAKAGRPLSQTTPPEEMYAIREPMYRRFADHHIHNDKTAEDAADAIVEILEKSI